MRIFRVIIALCFALLVLGSWLAGRQLQHGEVLRLQSPGADTPTAWVTGTPTVTSTPEPTGIDTKAPYLTNINIEPNRVNTTAASQLLTVTVDVRDDLSGLQEAILRFAPSSGGTQIVEFQVFDGLRVNGDRRNGRYVALSTLPKYSAHGRWYLTEIYLNDNASNSLDVQHLGYDGAIDLGEVLLVSVPYFVNGEDNGVPTVTPTPTTTPTAPANQLFMPALGQ